MRASAPKNSATRVVHLALGHSLSAVSGGTPNLFNSLTNLYPGVTTLMALSECPRAKCTTRVALFLGALALKMKLVIRKFLYLFKRKFFYFSFIFICDDRRDDRQTDKQTYRFQRQFRREGKTTNFSHSAEWQIYCA